MGRHRERHEDTLKVLNYFDGVHLIRRATTPALFSVALLDDVCPPSTVFASYNSYGIKSSGSTRHATAQSIDIYHFNGHEGGQEHHWVRQLKYVHKRFSDPFGRLSPAR
ncbi:acetylxylan esterase [Pseudarthrobacter sp. NamE5]|uniref:acetylxylan esterase n=1 Tax=Pseudarthrobacter sp. NamE5 TaxID=2576839 RepID=UPI002110640F|nr:acetylxylan esterase [Pseudarthrobacter sp. NamE5]